MPDSFKHNVSVIGGGQENFQQCWLASYRMLLKTAKRNPNEIEDKLKGAGIDVEDAKDKGLFDTSFSKAAAALGTKAWAGKTFKEEHWYNPGLSTGCQNFLEVLKDGPLWVSRFVAKGSYHIVIATGYSDDGNGYIIYNNPFPGPNNAVEVTTLVANVFVRHITDATGSVQSLS